MSSLQRASVNYNPQILFSGNSNVGKTSLIGKITGCYIGSGTSNNPTLGYDFIERKLEIGTPPNLETLKVRYYDQPFDMNQSPPSILRGRDIVVFVWSMIDLESFRNLGHHIDTIENICDAHNPYPPAIILCANKCDDCTSNTEFNLCKEQHSYPLIKTSKNGIGIEQLKGEISNILLKRYQIFYDKPIDNSFSTSVQLVVPDDTPEPKCCNFN